MQAEITRTHELTLALAAAAVLGVVSTVADLIWARFIPDGAVLPGVIHGVLIFALLAVVLGRIAATAGATRRLLATLPIAGLALAAAFYPLARATGYLAALLVTWIGMWLALALLLRWARRDGEALSRALARGLFAALGSGLAFWAVSGMWTDPAAHSSYLLRLVYWTFAFAPGFAALLLFSGAPRDGATDL